MTNQSAQPNPLWEDKIAAEAMNFVAAVQQNFHHGLTISLKHLPKNDAVHRMKQLDYFIDALVGVTAHTISKYGNSSKGMEETVKAAISQKFEYIRSEQAKAKIRQDLGVGQETFVSDKKIIEG